LGRVREIRGIGLGRNTYAGYGQYFISKKPPVHGFRAETDHADHRRHPMITLADTITHEAFD
jgi:hypothetical protein